MVKEQFDISIKIGKNNQQLIRELNPLLSIDYRKSHVFQVAILHFSMTM